MKNELLEILAKNCRLTNSQIAVMLGVEEKEVAEMIKELEENNIILGYPALIDWEKTDNDTVTAYIEVRVTPQRGRGFDKVAERIYQYPQVTHLSLMSGAYDLFVTVEGIRGKPIDPAKENIIHFIGFFLLMMLFIVITYKDILRLVG